MTHASYNNQARVHNGYHYPRSVLTALRSRVSFPRFVEEFPGCMDSDFEKYYLIARPLGKVSGHQFLKFCARIGASCEPAPPKIQRLVNESLIEACFSVTEYAFDAIKLRDVMKERLAATSVKSSFGCAVRSVSGQESGLLAVIANESSGEVYEEYADHVFNCTYSRINSVLSQSGIELIPLKHEMTEMCLVDVPSEFKGMGITVMCGPFFSVMPFPSAGLHSFSHVRYTPHYEWHEGPGSPFREGFGTGGGRTEQSAWRYMVRDAARYIPGLADCRYDRSLWEVKTVLPRSESDDSRPILFRPHHGLRGFHCVMGGKIDNVYDAVDAIMSQNVIG